jgi:glycosyltransferase involved in cell wall biosynthesis
MRLLCLVPKPIGISPGQRFRLEQWAPHLAARHGIDLDFLPFESPRLTEILYQPKRYAEKAFWVLRDTLRRRSALPRARSYDAVVLYREATIAGPPIYEHLLARRGVPMILDFDDAIWLDATSDGGPNGLFGRLRMASRKTETICRLATGIAVGNRYLEEYARRFNDNVHVVPTTIDLSRYSVRPLPPDEPFVIGWSGSLHTLVHLESARPALERLAQKRKIVIHVVCSDPPRPFAGAENRFTKWSDAAEVGGVAAAHVGIMPLPDTAHTRGKCAAKALQYMGVGRTVVVSPVGVNAEIVRHEKNGLLASSTDEWVSALERLAGAPAWRHELAIAARRTVEEGFSGEIGAAKFAAAVRASLESPASRARTRESVHASAR